MNVIKKTWFQLKNKYITFYLLILGVIVFFLLGEAVFAEVIPDGSKVLYSEVPNRGLEGNQAVGEINFAAIMAGIDRYVAGVMSIVATALLVWQGALLMASSEDADALAKRQKYIVWIILAFILILLAQRIIKSMLLGEKTQGWAWSDSTNFAGNIINELNGLFSFITPMLLALAVTLIVIGGVRLILGSASEEALASAKKQILYTILGILVLVSIKVILGIFVTDGKIVVPNGEQFIIFLANFLTYVAGFIGLFAFVAIVWAGLRLIFSFGNSETNAEVKRIIVYALAGLVLALFSYTIAFFLLP